MPSTPEATALAEPAALDADVATAPSLIQTPGIQTPGPKRILIVSSQTGGGHRSAARALEASLSAIKDPVGLSVNIAHRILEESSAMTRLFASIYNYMLRYHQGDMHHYFRWIESVKLYQQPWILQMSRRYCRKLLERMRPSAVVSVHPMTQHIFAGIIKALGWSQDVPLITVVTDPGKDVWQGWAHPDVAQYFVPSEDSKAYMESLGIPAEKINVSGMPVHPKFHPIARDRDDEARQALRQELGLDPRRFTLFLNAGWVGGGNVPHILDALLTRRDEDVQVIFLCGRNERLYRETCQKVDGHAMRVKVLPYTMDVHRWMQVSDVIVTKLGGLTTFEALSCHVPVLADCITPPMPQEAETANMIAKTDTGVLLYSVDQFLETLDVLRDIPWMLQHMREQCDRLAAQGASARIAEKIIQL